MRYGIKVTTVEGFVIPAELHDYATHAEAERHAKEAQAFPFVAAVEIIRVPTRSTWNRICQSI